MPQQPNSLVTTTGVTHYNVEAGVATFKKDSVKPNFFEDLFTNHYLPHSKLHFISFSFWMDDLLIDVSNERKNFCVICIFIEQFFLGGIFSFIYSKLTQSVIVYCCFVDSYDVYSIEIRWFRCMTVRKKRNFNFHNSLKKKPIVIIEFNCINFDLLNSFSLDFC
jgi:hypothetical protein